MQNPKMKRKPSQNQRNIFNRNYENKSKLIKSKKSRHFETLQQYFLKLEHLPEETNPIMILPFAYPDPDNQDLVELPI